MAKNISFIFADILVTRILSGNTARGALFAAFVANGGTWVGSFGLKFLDFFGGFDTS